MRARVPRRSGGLTWYAREVSRAVVPFALALVALGSTVARADSTLTIQLNDTGRALASEYQLDEAQLHDQIQNQIESVYQLANLAHLLRSFADIAAFANRGLGVDYLIDAGDAEVGVVGGGAVANGISLANTTQLVGGVITNAGVTGGVDLGRWGARRWSVFANGFYEPTSIHGLDGHLLTLGAHVQLRAITGRRAGAVAWGGVSVVSGLELARSTLGTQMGPINSHFTVLGTQPDQKKTVHVAAYGTFEVDARAYTVPLEVATGARFWDRLDVYAAAGVALTTGSADLTANLSGAMTINQGESIGTAAILAKDSGGPTSTTAHALFGLGLHTAHVRVFLQGEQATSTRTVMLGARGAF